MSNRQVRICQVEIMLAKSKFSCALCQQERKKYDEIYYGISRASNTISHDSFMNNQGKSGLSEIITDRE